MAKNIALFIDGSWNDAGDRAPTNVRKLYESARDSGAPIADQVVHYLAGVGTGRGVWNRVLGGAAGMGTAFRIREAYSFLVTHYAAGDRVYLFGFSRGAFAARSLAGFVEEVGLLLRDHVDLVEDAYALYEDADNPDLDHLREKMWPFLQAFAGSPRPDLEAGTVLPIHLIGVWDTVGALGIRWREHELAARFTEHHKTGLPSNVWHARHALALHELRPRFEPLPWFGASDRQTLEQRWFPGAHADVGGGYRETVLSDGALQWMAGEAVQLGLHLDHRGLYLDHRAPADGGPLGRGALHHEVRRLFVLEGAHVRQCLEQRHGEHPSATARYTLDDSVCERLRDWPSRQYRFAWPGVAKRLREVDEISLQLKCELADPAGLDAQPPRWWRSASVAEFERAPKLIESFVDGDSPPDAAQAERLAHAFALLLICEGPAALGAFERRLVRTEEARRVALTRDHAALDAFEQGWLQRLSVLETSIRTCASMLPEPPRGFALALSLSWQQLFASSQSELIVNRIRAGLGRDLHAPAKARFRARAVRPPTDE